MGRDSELGRATCSGRRPRQLPSEAATKRPRTNLHEPPLRMGAQDRGRLLACHSLSLSLRRRSSEPSIRTGRQRWSWAQARASSPSLSLRPSTEVTPPITWRAWSPLNRAGARWLGCCLTPLCHHRRLWRRRLPFQRRCRYLLRKRREAPLQWQLACQIESASDWACWPAVWQHAVWDHIAT